MKDYDPKEIEKKWQAEWEKSGLYRIPDNVEGEENEYVLVEFAYPSGNLHVGHWYAFSVPDIYVRYRRMGGKNVMYPMGFDAFGLPAENAAIKNGINPREWTFSNIEYMRNQLRSMGASFDWSREVVTASPEYYRWTQWLFLQFLEKGLVYRAETPANWCPSCKTVLANEQVVSDHCERCGTEVEKRNVLQWNIKITDYADRLIDDLEKLEWPRSIKESQKNWIGRSEGAEISFEVDGGQTSVKVFTTRPDTIYGATFLVKAGEKDRFTGEYVINPATGEKIPVWEAEYVLADYGTGAIMGVPADDERDLAFAEKHGLPVVRDYQKAGFEDFGTKTLKYRLRDWGVSRQRYWGCPIPVIHCAGCGPVAVPEKDLQVILPDTDDYLPNDEGQSPLAKVESWVNVPCPKCGEMSKRETDTLDTFVDSSWYFLRYADPQNSEEFASKEKQKLWMPVGFYSGGAEHTTMHLLYSRFFHKVLFDLGLVNEDEPYTRRMNRGLIMGPDGQKMSKSRGNVIDPDKEVDRLGADTVRMYMAFIGPYNEVGAYPWNPDAAVGVRRFLERVWKLKEKIKEGAASISLDLLIQKVSKEIESMKMNTAVSALMISVNELSKQENISRENFETLLQLLAPFAPHMAEELWQSLGHNASIHTSSWPEYDEKKLVASEVTIVVQVNGKMRGKFDARADLPEAEALRLAQELPEVGKWVVDKSVARAVYVPGKLVNLVLSV